MENSLVSSLSYSPKTFSHFPLSISHPSLRPKKERFSATNMRFRSTSVHKSAATVISTVLFFFLIHSAHCLDIPGAATEIFQKVEFRFLFYYYYLKNFFYSLLNRLCFLFDFVYDFEFSH